MMHFSFSSVLMTVFISNLLLVLIALLFRNVNVLSKLGYKLTAVFCIITLIRLLLPCELPFAKTVILSENLSNTISAIRYRHDIFAGIRLSIWDVFRVIWLLGSITYVGIVLYRSEKVKRLALRNSEDVTDQEPYTSILKEFCTEKQRAKIHLRMTSFVEAPMIMGLRNPVILIPINMDPSDKDIMFSLRHELYHYQHHDLWLEFAVNCLVAAYWWNPFTHMLNKQIGVLLEMRVDDSIISESEDASLGYVACILHYLLGKQDKKDQPSLNMGLALKKVTNLSRRIHMMQCKGQRPHYLLSTVMILLVVSMYIGSYLIIFENSSYRDEIMESNAIVLPSGDNCYAIQNEDGTYTVYIQIQNDSYADIVDSLDYYSEIKVYSSQEEYNEAIQSQ